MKGASFLENPEYLKHRRLFDLCVQFINIEVSVFYGTKQEIVFKKQMKARPVDRDCLYFYQKTPREHRLIKYRTDSPLIYMYSRMADNYLAFSGMLKKVKEDPNTNLSVAFSVEGPVFNRFYLHESSGVAYLDITKCASSSFREDERYKDLILTRDEILNRGIKTVAIIREPIDRIISGFLEVVKRKNSPESFFYYSQPEYDEIFDGRSIFESFRKSIEYLIDGKIEDSHMLPQTVFLTDQVEFERFDIDHFYRFENIQTAVDEHTGSGSYSQMKNINATMYKELKTDLLGFVKRDAELLKKLETYLARDFEAYEKSQ
jgi:hypothetical protein